MKTNLNTKLILVTPLIAQKFLLNNDCNRPVDSKTVNYYASLYKQGLWDEENGEVIKISTSGQLQSGQHRLLAVIKSNVPMHHLFVFNVSENARKTTDIGRGITLQNSLSLAGVSNVKIHAAILHALARYIEGTSKKNWVTLEYYDLFYREQIKKLIELNRKSAINTKLLPGPIAAAFVYLLKNDYDLAVLALDEYLEGTKLRCNAMVVFRNYLIVSVSQKKIKSFTETIGKKFFTAYYNFMQKSDITYFKDTTKARDYFLDKYAEQNYNAIQRLYPDRIV